MCVCVCVQNLDLNSLLCIATFSLICMRSSFRLHAVILRCVSCVFCVFVRERERERERLCECECVYICCFLLDLYARFTLEQQKIITHTHTHTHARTLTHSLNDTHTHTHSWSLQRSFFKMI